MNDHDIHTYWNLEPEGLVVSNFDPKIQIHRLFNALICIQLCSDSKCCICERFDMKDYGTPYTLP